MFPRKILFFNKKYWTHHTEKLQDDVSDFYYEFDFAVFIEVIKIRLILPESLLILA